MGITARKSLIKCITAREGPAQKISFFIACCFMRLRGGGGDAYKKKELKTLVENSFQERRY